MYIATRSAINIILRENHGENNSLGQNAQTSVETRSEISSLTDLLFRIIFAYYQFHRRVVRLQRVYLFLLFLDGFD